MAFIDDDEVEGFDGDLGVVDDGQGFAGEGGGGFEEGGFLVFFEELFFALEHGVQPLDGGDADLGGGVEGVFAEVLDVELFGELVGGEAGLTNCWNSLRVCLPRLLRSTRKRIFLALAYLMRR